MLHGFDWCFTPWFFLTLLFYPPEIPYENITGFQVENARLRVVFRRVTFLGGIFLANIKDECQLFPTWGSDLMLFAYVSTVDSVDSLKYIYIYIYI